MRGGLIGIVSYLSTARTSQCEPPEAQAHQQLNTLGTVSSRFMTSPLVVEGDGGTGLTGDYLRVRIGASIGKDGTVGEERSTPRSSFAHGTLLTGTLRGDPDDLYIESPDDSALPFA